MYRIWNCMLRRAEPGHAARCPSYAGTSVAPEFHRFADFAEWAMRQIGHDVEGYEIDKDLLVKGNRVYSPSTCVFLPKRLNSLFIRRSAYRGSLPIGVRFGRGSNFIANIKIDGTGCHLGAFQTPEDAFLAYKAAKEAHIKRVAELYRDQIDPRAYAALLAYQVEITD